MSLRVELDAINVNFGGVRAVRDVTLTVERGSITGLMGPNGAGKTTLFNVITNLVEPTSGRVRMDGLETIGLPMGRFADLGVARTFQTPRGFPSLSVRQNVEVMQVGPRDSLFGAIFRSARADKDRYRADGILQKVGLDNVADCEYDQLSGGQQRMLEIGRQLVNDVKLLLLDEPTAGLDITHQEQLRKLLLALNAEGLTILLVEHNLNFLLGTAHHVHVMDRGALIASAAPDEVRTDPAVMSAYLGGAGHEAAHA